MRLRRHGNGAKEAWERGYRGMGMRLRRHGNESRNMDKIRPTHNLCSKVEVYVQLQETDTTSQ